MWRNFVAERWPFAIRKHEEQKVRPLNRWDIESLELQDESVSFSLRGQGRADFPLASELVASHIPRGPPAVPALSGD